MPTTRRLAIAVLPLLMITLAGCSQIQEAGSKAKVCTDAIALAAFTPDPKDGEQAQKETKETGDKLHELAKNAKDGDVSGAITTLGNSYVDMAKQRVEDAANLPKWIETKVKQLDALRQACL
ncbi:hypothetical protein [Allokutzneria sp. NRRL B-24872]|uniref:hypothetical protein n=1 Tax=Allokutzneria sp. NRRL B-24872 TaxID=1137961 RepID=UPI000A3A18C2|nr:hypothetical protein [Allokutzneria sp. NRRL B-24872]